MTIVSSTDFRKNISKYIKESRDNITPIIVTTQKQGSVVVIPKEEWDAMQETFYLMSSPKNKERIDTAIANFRKGKVTPHNLIEE